MHNVRDTTGIVTIGAVSVRDASGLVAIGERWVRDASNALVQVFSSASSAFTAFASPETVYGAASRPGPASVTTNETTVTVTGGKAPYTYAWSSDGGFLPVYAMAAATAFRATVESGDTADGTLVCTVTDATGRVAISNGVQASASNYGRDLR